MMKRWVWLLLLMLVGMAGICAFSCTTTEHFTWDYDELIPGKYGWWARGFPQDLKSLISSLEVTSTFLVGSNLPGDLSFELSLDEQVARLDGQIPNQSGAYEIIYDLLNEAGCNAIRLTILLSIRSKAITTDVQEVGLLSTFIGHTDAVTSVVFSPDRKTFASGSVDHTIKLWDTGTGKELRTLRGHTLYVSSVVFSADGELIASASGDETIKLWDVVTGQLIRTITGHTGPVRSIAFSSDGTLLASGSDDDTTKLWEVTTGRAICSLKGDWISAVAFSPDGRFIASQNVFDTQVWEVVTCREVCVLTPESKHLGIGNIHSLAFSPDGKDLVTCAGNVIRLWNLDSAHETLTFTDHSDNVEDVAFSPDSSLLVSGSSDDTIKLWSVDTGQLLVSLPGYADIVESVAFSPDGKLIASGGYNGTVRIWDVQDVLPSPEVKTVCVQVSAIKTTQLHQKKATYPSLETNQLVFQVQDDDGSFDMSPPFSVCRVPGTHFTLQAPRQFLTEEQQELIFVRWEKYDEESESYILISESLSLGIQLQQGGLARAVYQLAKDAQDVGSPPVALFTWEVLSPEGARLLVKPKAGDRIRFAASASSDSDGQIVKYVWDWDSDGRWDEEITDPITKHSFMEIGTHQVTLRATDNDGLIDQTTKTIVIEHSDLIQADFSFHVVDAKLHKVRLDASSSIDTMGTIVRYEWDWDGDGIYDTAVQTPEMIHRFEGEGPYQVILTIVDDQENRASCTREVSP